MFHELEEMSRKITGFDAMSLQFQTLEALASTGLMVIREYHKAEVIIIERYV